MGKAIGIASKGFLLPASSGALTSVAKISGAVSAKNDADNIKPPQNSGTLQPPSNSTLYINKTIRSGIYAS